MRKSSFFGVSSSLQNTEKIGDVLDAFLTHISNEVSNLSKDIIQMAINLRAVTNKKQKNQFENSLLLKLTNFPPRNSSLSVLIPTFAAFASSQAERAFTSLDKYFPFVFSGPRSNESGLLSFFPTIPEDLDTIGYVISYISNKIFGLLVYALLENATSINNNITNLIIERLFIQQPLQVNTIHFSLAILTLKSFEPLVNRLSILNFRALAQSFNSTFPTGKKTTTPESAILFFNAFLGIKFSPPEFQEIIQTLNTSLKLFSTFSSNNEVIDALCTFLVEIVCQLKEVNVDSFLKKLGKAASSCLKSPISWASSLRLLGAIHYIKPPQATNHITGSKYEKFLQTSVYGRFHKPHKINAALDYIIALIRPSLKVSFNWSSQTANIVHDVFKHLFCDENPVILHSSNEQNLETAIQGNEEKAAKVLEYMAALDLQMFAKEWLPILLNSKKYQSVAFLALQNILNPMSGFQELAKNIPTNATTGIPFIIQQIIACIDKYIQVITENKRLENSKKAFFWRSMHEILESFDVPSSKVSLNRLNIPSSVLYALLPEIIQSYSPIKDFSESEKQMFSDSQTTTKNSLDQWIMVSSPSHQCYGDLTNVVHLQLIPNIEIDLSSKQFNFLPLIPIILYYIKESNNLFRYLLNLILSDDPLVAVYSSLIYELLFTTFPNKAFILLTELCNFIKLNASATEEQVHRLCLTFLYCFQAARQFIKGDTVELKTMTDFVSFLSLCSPFPETRLIGYQIMESTTFFLQLSLLSGLSTFLAANSTKIEQNVIISIVSSFSSSQCPVYKLPSVPIQTIALSPYIILWRFVFVEIVQEILNSSMANLLLVPRETFLELPLPNPSHLTLLFSTLTPAGLLFHKQSKKETSFENQWEEQNEKILNIVKMTGERILTTDIDDFNQLLFAFSMTNVHSILKVINILIGMIDTSTISDRKKLLCIIAMIFRRFSSVPDFDKYSKVLIEGGQIGKILSIFDTQLQMLSVQSFDQIDDLSILSLSESLIFRGRYYRFLHFSNLEIPNSPIPQRAISLNVTDSDISQIISREDLFRILFKWSINEGPFTDSSQVALTYLVSLGPIFTETTLKNQHFFAKNFEAIQQKEIKYPKNNFNIKGLDNIIGHNPAVTTEFVNNLAKIGHKQDKFLKHFLSGHFQLFFQPYLEAALTFPLEDAALFMNAIASQFIPPQSKNSQNTYSQESFIKNASLFSRSSPIKQHEHDFVDTVYLHTGTILLVSVLFLMHDTMTIRQNAMKIIVQLTPILSLLHYGYLPHEDNDNSHSGPTQIIIKAIRSAVLVISTQNAYQRLENAVHLSETFSKIFGFAAEQVLHSGLTALPQIWITRRCCTRKELIKILEPWTKLITIDLKRRYIIAEPSKFFVIYSPYSFLTEILECISAAMPLEFSSFWDNMATDTNLPFFNIAICDLALSLTQKPKDLAKSLLVLFYRLWPKTINFLIPTLQFDAWFFYHIQLGQIGIDNDQEILDFSDISDDSENGSKLDQANGVKKIHTVLSSVINPELHSYSCSLESSAYNNTLKFSVEALSLLAREDIMPLSNCLPTIISYCLTHIHLPASLKLLLNVSTALRASFDSGVPESLVNVTEILTRISSLPFESLIFSTTAVVKDLQRRIVSPTELLLLFKQVIGYLSVQESDLSDSLLSWGVSCGDFEVASRAIELYSAGFNQYRPNAFSLTASSLTQTILYLIDAKTSCQKASSYITSSLRALRRISTSKKNYAHSFWLAMAVLAVGEPENLKSAMELAISSIELGRVECPFEDVKPIVVRVIMECDEGKLVFNFVQKILNLPNQYLAKDNDFSLYAFVLSPLLLSANHSSVDIIESLIRVFGENSNLAKLLQEKIELTAENLVKAIWSSSFHEALVPPESLGTLCPVLCAFMRPGFRISPSILYNLAVAFLSVAPYHQTLNLLIPLTHEATLSELTPHSQEKTNYLRAVAQLSDAVAAQPTYKEKRVWEQRNFREIARNCLQKLVLTPNYEKGLTKIRFDVSSLPPLIPMERELIFTTTASNARRDCQGLQVEPFTNWATSLYWGQDLPEVKIEEDERPPLKFNIQFTEIITEMIENDDEFNEDEGREEAEKENDTIIDESIQDIKAQKSSQRNIEQMLSISPRVFLPKDEMCDALVKKVKDCS